MKRVLSVVLIMAVLCLLAGCGSGEKLSIIANDNSSVSLTAKELLKIQETDGRQWSNYENAKVSGEGVIKELTGVSGTESIFYTNVSSVVNGESRDYKYTEIKLKDNTVLLVRSEVVDNFYVGDEITFEGIIVSGKTSNYLLIDCCGSNDYDNPEKNISLK